MDLKEFANQEYYNTGDPVLKDNEFDLLADDGLEIKNFRNKTPHFQPMGSLKKIKTKEGFDKWTEGQPIYISPKLDGNSLEVVLNPDGTIHKAITRGDGHEGNDITEKVIHCDLSLLNVNCPGKNIDGRLSLKCEALFLKSAQEDYEKNIRNVVSGLLNEKEVYPEKLKGIKVVPFSTLDEKRFIYHKDLYEELQEEYNHIKEQYEFQTDGLVVRLETEIHEEENDLLPSNIVALKFNKDGVDAEVGYIEWNVGKYGKLCPVIVLKKSVVIDDTNVSRVSASNYGLLKEAGLGIGAKIKVIKSGDIIPYITDVTEQSTDLPEILCPCCGEVPVLNSTGVDLICENENCPSKNLIALQNIFGIFDLEFISGATIELLYENGFDTLEKIFFATEDQLVALPRFGVRKAANIKTKLKNVTITESQAIECSLIKGISKRQSTKLIEHFGSLDTFVNSNPSVHVISQIDSFGNVMAKNIVQGMSQIRNMVDELKKCGVTIVSNSQTQGESKGNIVFTGKCEQYDRKKLTSVLEEMGYTVQGSVNKTTDILLTNDPESNSSKTKKAKQLGVQIKSYDEFL